MSLRIFVVLPIILILVGCDRVFFDNEKLIYTAWEDGLTLIYENPTITDFTSRINSRQTVRVKAVKRMKDGLIITKTYDSLGSHSQINYIYFNNGAVICNNASSSSLILPAGFPDRIIKWQSLDILNWLIGRAMISGINLGNSVNTNGIWVESASINNKSTKRITRTLYLPNVGEAETKIWDNDKHCWATVRKLVSCRFTDAI